MRNRILACIIATLALIGIGGIAPASAAEGHVNLYCGSSGTDSTFWETDYWGTQAIASICTTVKVDGGHVDVTYGLWDRACDGRDVNLYRDLNFVSDGWVYIGSTSGCGDVIYVNKQYDRTGNYRWARAESRTFDSGLESTFIGEVISWY